MVMYFEIIISDCIGCRGAFAVIFSGLVAVRGNAPHISVSVVAVHVFDNEMCTFGLRQFSYINKGEMTNCGLKHLLIFFLASH